MNKSNKNQDTSEKTNELENLIKKLLVLELFKLNVVQSEIGKKLKMDINSVNEFLRGIKKK